MTKPLSKSAIAALKAGFLRYCYGGPCTGDVSYYVELRDPNVGPDIRHYVHIVRPLIKAGFFSRGSARLQTYLITPAGTAALNAATKEV